MADLATLYVAGRAYGDTAPSDDKDFVRKLELDAEIAAVNSHAPVTVPVSQDSVVLSLSTQQVSATLKRKTASLTSVQGLIGHEATNGHFVALGTTANTAAAGNHTHDLADASDPGFMSAAHFSKLEALPVVGDLLALVGTTGGTWGSSDTAARSDHSHAMAGVADDGLMSSAHYSKLAGLPASPLDSAGVVSLMLTKGSSSISWSIAAVPSVIVKSASLTATEGYLLVTAGGLVAKIGTGANDLAAGNHSHSLANGSSSGFMAAADFTKLSGIATGATVNAYAGSGGLHGSAATAARSDHWHAMAADGVDGFMRYEDFNKLAAIAAGATVNAYAGSGGDYGSSGDAARADHLHAVASGSAKGFMSAAHFSKLENLPADATNVGLVSSGGNAGSAGTAARSDHTHTFDGLSDVVLTSVASGDTLRFNGSNWVNTNGLRVYASSIELGYDTSILGAVTFSQALTLGVELSLANGGTGANSASGARSSLGLGTLATQAASSVAITGGQISAVDIRCVNSATAPTVEGQLRFNALDGTLRVGDGGGTIFLRDWAQDQGGTAFVHANNIEANAVSDNAQIDLTLATTVLSNARGKVHASFYLAITGSGTHTIGAPIQMVDGGWYVWTITRSAGTPTLSFDAVFKFGSGTAPSFGADNAVVVMGMYAQGVLRCQHFANFE